MAILILAGVLIIVAVAFLIFKAQKSGSQTKPEVLSAIPETANRIASPVRVTVTTQVNTSYQQNDEDVDFEAAVEKLIPQADTDKRFYNKISGTSFPNDDGSSRTAIIAKCSEFDLLELRPEPENPYDSNAVAVFSKGGLQLGYLETRLAADVVNSTAKRGPCWTAVFRRPTRLDGDGDVVGAIIYLTRSTKAHAGQLV